METEPRETSPQTGDGIPPETLLKRRLELEREREARLNGRVRKDMYHSAPHYPEYWFEKILNASGLRSWGEANALQFQLREIAFSFPNLPSAFDGFRILHLSDIHFRQHHPEIVDGLCDLLAGVEADFCAFTGDFLYSFTRPFDHVIEGTRRLLDVIEPAHGSAAVLGNHDFAAFVDSFGAMGLPVLMNEHFTLELGCERIWIAGVDDSHRFRCDDLPQAMRGVPPEEFAILLAHTPELAAVAPDYGIDFYLCGHTHCGQVCLPGGFPLVLNARAPRKYCSRVWRNGPTQGYTSPGLGTTDIPVRFFCPPEATIITLNAS